MSALLACGTIVGMVGVAAVSVAAAAGSAEAGKTKAAVCMGCHGPDGSGAPGTMRP